MKSPSERFRWVPKWIRRLPGLRRWFWRRSWSAKRPRGWRDRIAEAVEKLLPVPSGGTVALMGVTVALAGPLVVIFILSLFGAETAPELLSILPWGGLWLVLVALCYLGRHRIKLRNSHRRKQLYDEMITGWDVVAKRFGLRVLNKGNESSVKVCGKGPWESEVLLGKKMGTDEFRYEVDGSDGALPRGLLIGTESLLANLVYDGGGDVQLGEPEFDRVVSIIGDELTAFAALDAPARAALTVLVGEHGASFEGGLLRVLKSGLIRDADELEALAEPLFAAARGLGRGTSDRLDAVIARSSSDPVPGVRRRALELLLRRGVAGVGVGGIAPKRRERTVQAIRDAVSDPAPEVRRLVAEHHELLEEAQLELLLRDEDPKVRQTIRAALGIEAEQTDGSLSLVEESERAGELSLARQAGQLSKPEGGLSAPEGSGGELELADEERPRRPRREKNRS